MQDIWSRTVAMGEFSVELFIEYGTSDTRFRGSRAWGGGKGVFEQFTSPPQNGFAGFCHWLHDLPYLELQDPACSPFLPDTSSHPLLDQLLPLLTEGIGTQGQAKGE